VSKTILYAKIGRSCPLTIEKCSSLGGDIEFVSTLKLLAKRHPEDLFVIIGRNSGEEPTSVGLPENVVNPWYHMGDMLKTQLKNEGLRYPNLSVVDQLRIAEIIDSHTMRYFNSADEVIMWAGQHGTTSTPIPTVKDRSALTKPQDSSALYGGFLLRGINNWRNQDPHKREEIWLNADTRNYLKMRDLAWPLRHPVLCQYDYQNNIKHEHGGTSEFVSLSWRQLGVESAGPGVWSAKVRNEYARLEINAMMPGTPFGDRLTYNDIWAGRGKFGIIVNETRVIGVREADGRKAAIRDWVLPFEPDFIHGTWSKASCDELSINPTPIGYDDYITKLQSVHCTITTPASGSGWATAKPWEAFAAGTVCFFHPKYDDQNHILKDAPPWLQKFLRVTSVADMRQKMHEMETSPLSWHNIVTAQREHFVRAVKNPLFIRKIEERIYG
jgi:hypothetical protein